MTKKKKKWGLKIAICIEMGRKHCRKRRKFWLPALLLFPLCYQKDYFSALLEVEIVWERVKKLKMNSIKLLFLTVIGFDW